MKTGSFKNKSVFRIKPNKFNKFPIYKDKLNKKINL